MTGRGTSGEIDPDHDILARVAAGETEPFRILVERHQQSLVRLCERLLQDPEAARDAAQEVFLKAFRKAGSFRPQGQVYTWLYRIAVNHCLNQLRRRRIVRFLGFSELTGDRHEPDSASPAFEPESQSPDAWEQLKTRRQWQQTRQLIETLPAGQRAVLILAKFEGLSYRDIAQTLDITEGAVESRLFRAMTRLRRERERMGS